MDEQTTEPVTETGDSPVQEKPETPNEEETKEENVVADNSTPIPSAGEVTEVAQNAENKTESPAENKEPGDEGIKEETEAKEGEEKLESAENEEGEKKAEETQEVEGEKVEGEKEEGVGEGEENKEKGEEKEEPKDETEVPPQTSGESPEPAKDGEAPEGEAPEGEAPAEAVMSSEMEESVEVVERVGAEGTARTPNIEDDIIMEEEAEEMMSEEEVPQYNREELIQKYQASVTEREQLKQQNYALQHKLAEYFRKKKTEESRQEADKNVSDQEQRYFKYMSNLEELRLQLAADQEAYNEQLEEFKERKTEKQSRVEEEWKNAIEYKKAVAMAAINSRSGRPIPPKDVELYETNERKKESEVSQVRLENIKLKNRLKKQESQLKQKEELAEGLHLIDFEQLKIENQTYNEKIEERNEELLKLRKKITNTVQVLTHLKEKLQFVQGENQVKKQHLSYVEQHVAKKRDVLSRTKQVRDALRHDNGKLLQKSGLLGNTDLLRDFEIGTDEANDLQYRLEQLKRNHAELTLSLNGVKKKIELTKENQT